MRTTLALKSSSLISSLFLHCVPYSKITSKLLLAGISSGLGGFLFLSFFLALKEASKMGALKQTTRQTKIKLDAGNSEGIFESHQDGGSIVQSVYILR